MTDTHDLTLVMPIYNEEGCIAEVVEAWLRILERLQISFSMILLDDGSTDGTAGILQRFSSDPRIVVIKKSNSGHGPTILLGYRLATDRSPWVFQTDSDDEIPPESLPDFWRNRDGADAILGIRTGRAQNASRRLMSRVSRVIARWLFRSTIADVNVPYRLLRSSTLKSALALIPADSFSPNILITAFFSLAGLRMRSLPVQYRNRGTGSTSLAKWRLWKGAMRAFLQLLTFRLKMAFRSTPL